MNIFCISDTHGFHEQIEIPDDIDMIIHAGDASNSRFGWKNEHEIHDFLMWYDGFDIKYKIFVPGNHDVSIENGQIRLSHYSTITPLIHELIEIKSVKIFGSPYTPEFCDWAYNVEYDKLLHYWEFMPEDLNILITHGPPLNIMDTIKGEYRCENVGDKYLFDAVYERNPQYHIFGHIHDNNGVKNNGIRTIRGVNTRFINASIIKDSEFNKGIINKGITIKI